jgi:transcriptional regulator
MSEHLTGIIGFDIQVSERQAAYKLSQNRDPKNLELIIDELEKKGDENAVLIAAGMKKKIL